MKRWDSLVDRYIEECTARGMSPATVYGIRSELDRWGAWLKRRRPKPHLEEVGSELLVAYIRDRSAFRSKATVGAVVSRMRCMGEFLVREGTWSENPFRWIKGPKQDPRSHLGRRISKEAMRRLWQSAAENRQGYSRSLWLAVLALLYGTGIRRGELERLETSDWNREEGTLEVDGRKTGWERRLVLPDVSRACLESYLVQRHNHLEQLGRLDERSLLVGQQGFRLQGEHISQGIRRLLRRAGLEGITIHQFRHTCASDLLEAGLHVVQVQEILGHRAIGTTVRYLHVADPQRTAAVRLHPINDLLKAQEISDDSEEANRIDRGLLGVSGTRSSAEAAYDHGHPVYDAACDGGHVQTSPRCTPVAVEGGGLLAVDGRGAAARPVVCVPGQVSQSSARLP